jgi:hypothetical protein
MCQSCNDIDQQIEEHRKLLRSPADAAEIERIKRLISQLYADRVRLHKNPEN